MTFDEYQNISKQTALYPAVGHNIYYPAMGLAGESGEICNVVKKIMRDNNGVTTEEVRENLKKEIGDVLWYVSALCGELGITMGEVAEKNIEKLQKRLEKGTIKGSGDER